MQRLWVRNYRNLNVVVFVEDGARKFGFTDDDIRTKVRLRLRQAQIRPLQTGSASELSEDQQTLEVDVQIVGLAFNVGLEFQRSVVCPLPNNGVANIVSPTWTYAVTGTHGHDRAYVLSGLDEALDTFLNYYLKANQDMGL